MKVDNELIVRYLNGQCSKEEMLLVEEWFAEWNADIEIEDSKVDEIVSKLDDRMIHSLEKSKVREFPKWVIAAAVAAVFLIIGFLFYPKNQLENEVYQLSDIKAPVGSNAIVVLEDNSEYDLDKLNIGDSVLGKGYFIIKDELGEIRYRSVNPNAEIVYNTVKTKAGGITSIVMSDGSRVWLNSKSEIRYPVTFAADKREVALQGEAYFEIAKKEKMPFYVFAEGHSIKVLGTKFNVRNYQLNFVTTLLEGSVVLANETAKLGEQKNIEFPVVLKPNQAYNGNHVYEVEDASKAIDWVEGYFDFSDVTLEEACLKLSNWYDVSFTIDEKLKKNRIYSQISKDKSLKQVLNLISEIYPMHVELKQNQINLKSTK